MFVDSHCHLVFPELRGRLPEVLAEMRQARVDAALCICTTLEEFEQVHALARPISKGSTAPIGPSTPIDCAAAVGPDNPADPAGPVLWATVGVHPDSEGVAEPDEAALLERASRDQVLAIGETGLDYYRIGARTWQEMGWQRERFRVHVRAARQCGLPLVVHTRSASVDTLAILREEGGGAVGGVFHCFTETLEVARAALDLGFDISFSGILTFRNAAELREVAAFVPLERCLIETDSPYLAPVPHRGKVNSPAWVVHVAAELARIKGLSIEEVARVTTGNFLRLFRPPQSASDRGPDALQEPARPGACSSTIA